MASAERNYRVRLSDLQLDVMRVLWRTDASVAEVVEALRPTRALAHTTIATVLTRLERAGMVACVREGRALRYRACLTESSVRQAMVNDLLETVFQGDIEALLAHMIEERRSAQGTALPAATDDVRRQAPAPLRRRQP